MEVKVIFSGLTSATTASHIHCCLPSPFATRINEPVGTTFPTFPSFPLKVTSGTYDETFDLTANSTYNLINIPPGNTGDPFLGTSAATAEPVFVATLLNGQTYLNIDTSDFPTGEIRGFLAVVPGPAGLLGAEKTRSKERRCGTTDEAGFRFARRESGCSNFLH
jgi:hypothetical protein